MCQKLNCLSKLINRVLLNRASHVHPLFRLFTTTQILWILASQAHLGTVLWCFHRLDTCLHVTFPILCQVKSYFGLLCSNVCCIWNAFFISLIAIYVHSCTCFFLKIILKHIKSISGGLACSVLRSGFCCLLDWPGQHQYQHQHIHHCHRPHHTNHNYHSISNFDRCDKVPTCENMARGNLP